MNIHHMTIQLLWMMGCIILEINNLLIVFTIQIALYTLFEFKDDFKKFFTKKEE